MALLDVLLPEFDREVGVTRALFERLPSSDLHWVPHSRSMSLGRLAGHVADLPRWIDTIVHHDGFDLGTDEPPTTPTDVEAPGDVITRFDDNVATARATLLTQVDGTLEAPWTLTRRAVPIFTMPRFGVIRYFVLNHLIHHRGQLSVYLRLRDVPLPALYGPSADEGGF